MHTRPLKIPTTMQSKHVSSPPTPDLPGTGVQLEYPRDAWPNPLRGLALPRVPPPLDALHHPPARVAGGLAVRLPRHAVADRAHEDALIDIGPAPLELHASRA